MTSVTPFAYSIKHTRTLLGDLSRGAVDKLVKEGKLKTIAIGRRRLILATSLQEFLDASARGGQP